MTRGIVSRASRGHDVARLRKGPASIGVADGLLEGLHQSLDLLLAAEEPVRGPDPVEAPAQCLQVLLPQAVAVTRGGGGVVAGAVAFDGQHVLAWAIRVREHEIDSVTGRPELGNDVQISSSQGVRDRLLEVVERD
jgi:hypothetical protein